jgi:glycosyltransferase involved in cell wall biosynthesis
MRALVLSHAHPAFSIGGAQVAAYNLFKGLNRHPGWSAHFMAGVGPPIARHRATALMKLDKGPDETLFWSNEFDWFYLAAADTEPLARDVERFLADHRPDVVNLHHFMGFGAQIVRAIRRALGPDTPIVMTLHEYLAICANHGQMIKPRTGALCRRSSPSECGACFPEIGAANMMRRRYFIKSMLAEVDAFVSPSRFLLERFGEWGLPQKKLVMIENGLDGGTPAPPRGLSRSGGRRNRFAYFGQLNPFKGVKVLIEAVARIPDAVWGEDGLLMIFGGNLEHQPAEFQQEMREAFRRAGRRVRFMGSYKSEELPDLMRDVDWTIVPSTWWENSPVVIQEAFFHGRPVIASDIGGMAEKVRNEIDGLTFRIGSPGSLAEAMARAIAEPDLWNRLRQGIRPPSTAEDAAREHARLFERLFELRDRARIGAAVAPTLAAQ